MAQRDDVEMIRQPWSRATGTWRREKGVAMLLERVNGRESWSLADCDAVTLSTLYPRGMTLLRMLLTPPLYSAHMHRVSCELAGNDVPVLTTFNYIKLHCTVGRNPTRNPKSKAKSRNPTRNLEIQHEIQKSNLKSRNPTWNPEIQLEILKSNVKSRNPYPFKLVYFERLWVYGSPAHLWIIIIIIITRCAYAQGRVKRLSPSIYLCVCEALCVWHVCVYDQYSVHQSAPYQSLTVCTVRICIG